MAVGDQCQDLLLPWRQHPVPLAPAQTLVRWRQRLAAAGDKRASILTRFRRTFGSIAGFTLGCAAAAALYAWIGFWCLAVPVVIAALAAAMRLKQ